MVKTGQDLVTLSGKYCDGADSASLTSAQEVLPTATQPDAWLKLAMNQTPSLRQMQVIPSRVIRLGAQVLASVFSRPERLNI
ncbi:hypothetical protein KVT40_002821 [Elsinoe batatas]|uniref:Uncharacterized protein n=1 Tax=Elsinoe batatas TaxID=2601811 RepID=A0A8K0L741_9PEZI|nr:hypothetical protein KVT40_002821 [Elsinoe batatas]